MPTSWWVRFGLPLVLVILAACLPSRAVKEGDAAAARGEWRAAEKAYRRAVADKPGDEKLAAKYADAKTRAIAEALKVAEACQAGADLACIEKELAYVIEVDPANVDASRRRADARRGLAANEVVAARAAIDRREPDAAWRHLDQARQFGLDGAATAEADALDGEATAQAVDIVRQLVAAVEDDEGATVLATLDRAAQLANAAASRDGSHASLAATVTAARHRAAERERQRWIDAADQHWTAGRYREATTALAAAQKLRVDEQTARRLTFATAMVSGAEATDRRAYADAARWYQQAIGTQVDTRMAQALLDAVEPRVYGIRIESLAIQPVRPGTSEPWVGKPWWKGAAPVLAGAVVGMKTGPVGAELAHDITAGVLSGVRDENRPTLQLRVDVPDGRAFQAVSSQKGLFVVYQATIFVRTNHYDTRTLRLHVVHKRFSGDESVALVNIPLGRIVANQVDAGDLSGSVDALRGIVFDAQPVPDWADGGYDRLVPLDASENRAPKRSTPRADRQRVQLASIGIQVVEVSDGWGTPEPYVKILQDGQEILRTSKGSTQSRWTFSMTDLFISPSETLEVFLMEADASDDDTLARWPVTGASFRSGRFELATQKGSRISITAQPRNDGPN